MQRSGAVKKRICQSLFFAFQNNFFYIQLAFVFDLLENFYIVHELVDAFRVFLLHKDFYVFHDHVFAFCLYLLQKYFETFHEPVFEAFLCCFSNIHLTFFYKEKNYKKYFISFLYALRN